MNPVESFKNAFANLRVHKMRSALTILGITIGVGTVIMLLALSLGAKSEIDQGIEDIGSNIALVVPGKVELEATLSTKPSEMKGGVPFQSNRLRPEMAEDIRDRLPEDYYVTPAILDARPVSFGDSSYFTQFIGTDEFYPMVRDQGVSSGTFFKRRDADRKVCVIGATTAERLFAQSDPLGKEIRIGPHRFKVLGVLAEKGRSFLLDNDDIVLVPYGVYGRLYGKPTTDYFLVKSPTAEEMDRAASITEEVLLEDLEADEFTVIPQTEMLGFAGSISRIMTWFVVAIACISLLVGGIGIMNIMLVSVTERTNEIGLRKAVGAKSRSIMGQFLAEALAMSLLGGLAGVGLAVFGSMGLGSLLGIPERITTWSIALAFGFSLAVGVFFGLYPAFKAARMDPIEAMRYE